MGSKNRKVKTLFPVRVELFGTSRIRAGRNEIELMLGEGCDQLTIVQALAAACP
jgi:hypothetical protein